MSTTNDNRPPAIIVKKVISGEAGHHGGAWKVAYADFVTAMMAFFLLMWIIGATTEDQRKGIADYFRPTLAQTSDGGGANGFMAGRSLHEKDGIAISSQKALTSLERPIDQLDFAGGPQTTEASRADDFESFEDFRERLLQIVQADPELEKFADQFNLSLTPEGLRLEVTDAPGASMFQVGETSAAELAGPVMAAVSEALSVLDNEVAIRGHTDGRRYTDPHLMNNWLLSTGRADVTRRMLVARGVDEARFGRIEGSADKELRNADDPLSASNRRISITLLYSEPTDPSPSETLYRAEAYE